MFVSYIDHPFRPFSFSTISICILLIFLLLLPLPTIAGEVDSFQHRKFILSPYFENSKEILNQYINHKLKKVIEQNMTNKCDKEELISGVLEELGDIKILNIVNFPIGKLEFKIDSGHFSNFLSPMANLKGKFQSFRTKKENSIYSDLSLIESIGTFFYLSSAINFNNWLIGTDKISHFFTQGYDYYLMARDKGLMEALRWGYRTESDIFGFWGTGIFSYADLSANFGGLYFWVDFLADSETFKKYFPSRSPLLKCDKGKWVMLKPFRWEDYITAAWDEGLNPNSYRNETIKNKVELKIFFLLLKGHIDRFPPLDPAACKDMLALYPKETHPYLISPQCQP